MKPAIEVRDVYKTFRIPHERHTTLTERLLHLFHQVEYEQFEALRGIDLEIDAGSFVGIIGRNGSGKSTLLKLMAGLLPPDRGEVHVTGTMSALLELGLGFSAELTVRENVELYAAVLGYPRREIRRRIEEAIRFAELERFRDAKLKNLSTGMKARLGFATALQAESDILLLDEILAVGDESFQRKCLDVFTDLKRRGKTIVLVTHGLDQVDLLCDYAFFLDAGRIGAEGAPKEVIASYLRSVNSSTAAAGDNQGPSLSSTASEESPEESAETSRVRFLEGWIESGAGARVDSVDAGDRPVLVALAEVLSDLENPIFGLLLNEHDGPIVFVTNSGFLGASTGRLSAGQTVQVRIPFDAPSQEGAYILNMIACSADKTVLYGKTGDFVRFTAAGGLHRYAMERQVAFQCQVVNGADDDKVLDSPGRLAGRGGIR